MQTIVLDALDAVVSKFILGALDANYFRVCIGCIECK